MKSGRREEEGIERGGGEGNKKKPHLPCPSAKLNFTCLYNPSMAFFLHAE